MLTKCGKYMGKNNKENNSNNSNNIKIGIKLLEIIQRLE